MKRTKNKKQDTWLNKWAKKMAKRLIVTPSEYSKKIMEDEFFVFNEKTGYYEPIKRQ